MRLFLRFLLFKYMSLITLGYFAFNMLLQDQLEIKAYIYCIQCVSAGSVRNQINFVPIFASLHPDKPLISLNTSNLFNFEQQQLHTQLYLLEHRLLSVFGQQLQEGALPGFNHFRPFFFCLFGLQLELHRFIYVTNFLFAISHKVYRSHRDFFRQRMDEIKMVQ